MKIVNVQNKWKVIYFTYKDSIQLIIDNIEKISNVSAEWVKGSYYKINYGFTYSIPYKKTSIVFISESENKQEYMSTFVHELKHVQTHICDYYNISESGEEAAYLIGYLAKLIFQ